MLTAHQRTRLHRQEFLDTDTAVYATQPGPLTAAELRDHWPPRRGGVAQPDPALLRHGDEWPEAAHAATDIGSDDDDSLAVFVGARNALLLMAAIALCIGFVVWVLR